MQKITYIREAPVRPPSLQNSVLAASFWMVAVSLLLFFVPLVNGIIGGFVGGYKLGSVGRALRAAIPPAIIVATVLWIAFAILQVPVWELLAGMRRAALIALADVGIFVGAAIGGALGSRVPGR